METMQPPLTFVSYSRKQLYFAEALALHLQKEGIKIWFDLQQLQAGTEWSEGLKDGVQSAKQMVLVVSEAAMESPYTKAEWQGFAEKGRRIALVVYESVELPEELKGLPTYDFRGDFNKKLKELVAFLREEAEPRHDPIPAANQFDLPTKLSSAVWVTLLSQFGALITLFLSFLLTLILNPAGLWSQIKAPAGMRFFFIMFALSLLIGGRYALPFLQRKLAYKKIGRSALINFLLLLPASIAIGQIRTNSQISTTSSASLIYSVIAASMALLTIFVYLFFSKRSAGLLRWMQSEEDVQNLRRRVHQPLVEKTRFNIDAAKKPKGEAITYTLHADQADQPFARWVEGIFKKAGHTRVNADENPEQHIALLSNRNSDAWVQEVTSAHAGKLAFVVISTIEFKDSLRETGRYQWIDARGADEQDIAGLARSLGNVESWKREAAIEATPAMIHRWKVPNSITLLKRMMEAFAIYLLIFGLTDLVGFLMSVFGFLASSADGNAFKSILLVMIGGISFWLANKSLVYRKIPAKLTYAILGGLLILASMIGTVPLFPELLWLIVPALLYTAVDSHFWLPANAKVNVDEVGINQSIAQTFQRRSLIAVSLWVIAIVAFALLAQFKLG